MTNKVKLYYNEDHTAYAVLISPGWGSGWFTANPEYPEIAYDARVVEWYLAHDSPEYWANVGFLKTSSDAYLETRKFFDNLGYTDLYFGGFKTGMLRWVPVDAIWRIEEYDGAERIEYLDLREWNQFKDD